MIEHLKCYERGYPRRSPTSQREDGRDGKARWQLYLCRLLISWCVVILVGCTEQILHDLAEQDANKVLSRLSGAHVGAKKVLQSDGRWAIAVPKGEIVSALAFLDTNRVLAPRSSVGVSAGRGSFVPSREEQWFRYERSVAVSIEESLSTMQGVLEARVHLNLPETDPLFGNRKEDVGSGSVLLVIDPRFMAQDQEIAALVGGAAGVPAAKVTVLRSSAHLSLPREPEILPAQATTREAALVGGQVQVVAHAPTVAPVAEVVLTTPEPIAKEGQSAPLIQTSEEVIMRHADVGIASLVVLLGLAGGAYAWRRRARRATFSLPEGVEVSE